MPATKLRALALKSRLDAQLVQPPRTPRSPLFLNGALIGSVEPEFLKPLASCEWLQQCPVHAATVPGGLPSWHLSGPAQTVLPQLANALRQAGLSATWRDELLAVVDANQHIHGAIERGVVRVLGLQTHSVGLVGWTATHRIWVQQRAATKPDNPLLWDILSNGMVAAANTLHSALQRETMEEAGLEMQNLQALRHGGQFFYARPASAAAKSAGYLREAMDWFSALVPEHLTPNNQDGEVAQFTCLTADEALDAIENHQFTPDAAYVLAAEIGNAQFTQAAQ